MWLSVFGMRRVEMRQGGDLGSALWPIGRLSASAHLAVFVVDSLQMQQRM